MLPEAANQLGVHEQLSSLLISYVFVDGEAELVEEKEVYGEGSQRGKVERWFGRDSGY